jgi:hypothetical protein
MKRVTLKGFHTWVETLVVEPEGRTTAAEIEEMFQNGRARIGKIDRQKYVIVDDPAFITDARRALAKVVDYRTFWQPGVWRVELPPAELLKPVTPEDRAFVRAKPLLDAARACLDDGSLAAAGAILHAVRLVFNDVGFENEIGLLTLCFEAMLMEKHDEISKALPTVKVAADIAERILADTHPLKATCFGNRGACHLKRGERRLAKTWLQRCVDLLPLLSDRQYAEQSGPVWQKMLTEAMTR